MTNRMLIETLEGRRMLSADVAPLTLIDDATFAPDPRPTQIVHDDVRWTLTYDHPSGPDVTVYHFDGFVDTSATASNAAAPVSEDGEDDVISPTLAADADDVVTLTLVTDPDEIAALIPDRPTELVHGNVRYTLTCDHPSVPDVVVLHFAGFVDDALPGEEQPDTLLA